MDMPKRDAYQKLLAENARLRQALSGLTGLAKMRGGYLHEYKSAVEEAEEILSQTSEDGKA